MKQLRMWRVYLLLVCFVPVFAQAEVTQPDAAQLFIDMSKSFSELSYDGIFVHSEENQMNSMRVKHERKEGKEYESLVDLDGQKIKVLRIGDTVICVYPNESYSNKLTLGKAPFDRFKQLDVDRLKQGYRLELSDKMGRIAGRDARVLKLVPKDDYRYGHELWLDNKNHFLLKHDITDASGKLLDRIQFTAVNFHPNLKRSDFIPKKGEYSEKLTEPMYRAVKSQWTFDWLPPGFALVWPNARAIHQGSTMLLLSDGMASISVFVDAVNKPKKATMMTMGATMAGEKTIKVGNQLYLVTMVGEVPSITIEKLMSVFRPKAKDKPKVKE